jgi:hypothetical protein
MRLSRVNSKLYHLWLLLSQSGDGDRHYAFETVAPLEPMIGREATEAFRRGLQRSQSQHDDLTCPPCTQSCQSDHRRPTPARHGRRSPNRLAHRMVPAARDARRSSTVGAAFEPSLWLRQSLFPGNGILPPETKAPKWIRSAVRRDQVSARKPCPCRKLCTWRTGANRVMLVADDSAAQFALWCAHWSVAVQRTA